MSLTQKEIDVGTQSNNLAKELRMTTAGHDVIEVFLNPENMTDVRASQVQ